MADPTDAELLSAARTALQTALATGQSVTFYGRSYTSHDLAELRALVSSLSAAVAATSRSRLAAFQKGV